MTPDQESNMRAELADYSKTEFTDLAIRLQKTIDVHVAEKRGRESSDNALAIQVGALQEEVARLEAELEGSAGIDNEQVEQLRAENEQLRERLDRLQGLNEKLQEKLVS